MFIYYILRQTYFIERDVKHQQHLAYAIQYYKFKLINIMLHVLYKCLKNAYIKTKVLFN